MNYRDYNDNELCYMIKENNEDALYTMLTKYETLIKSNARDYKRKYNNSLVDLEDLEQEGRLGLLRALEHFDNDYNVLFFTFALLCVKRSMNNYIRKTYSKANLKFNSNIEEIDEISYKIKDEKIEDFSFLIEDNNYYKKIIEFKNNLSIINSQIFELRFNGFKYSDIAELLDIKVKKVDNSMLNIKGKLKNFLLNS